MGAVGRHLAIGAAMLVTLTTAGPVSAQGTTPAQSAGPGRPVTAPRLEAAARLPLVFEPNRGQADRRVRYLARGIGQSIYLSDAEAAFVLPIPGAARKPGERGRAPPADAVEALVLRMVFAGASEDVRLGAGAPRAGVVNHVVGADPRRWRTRLPAHDEVTYRGLYPGVDLLFHPGEGGLAFDFVVAPRADARAIRLRYPTAEALSLDAAGNLVLRLAGREIRQRAPRLYQEPRTGQDSKAGREAVEGGYVLLGKQDVGFRIGRYDRTRPLIIDPTFDVGAVFGGGDYEFSDLGFAVGPSGDVFVAGWTLSADFPVIGGAQSVRRGESDAFIARLDAATLDLAYATYFGGAGRDFATSVAVAGDGRPFVAGGTLSDDLPAPPAGILGAHAGSCGGVVVALGATGLPDYVRYLGGAGSDTVDAIAIGGTTLVVAGSTSSPDFATLPMDPAMPAVQDNRRNLGYRDGFVARFDLAAPARPTAR